MAKRLEGGGTSLNGTEYTIDIYDNTWSGVVTEFQTSDELFTLEYKGQTEERFNPVLSSSCIVNIMVQESNKTELEQFITDLAANTNEDRFLVVIGKSGSPWWYGVVMIDRVVRTLTHYPYTFQIRFSDGIGRLKDIDYNDDGTEYTGRQTIIQHLFQCLDKTATYDQFQTTDEFLKTYVEWYANEMTYSVSDDPLDKSRVNNKVFVIVDTEGEVTFETAYTVLEEFAKAWGARILFSAGTWHFVQVNGMNSTAKTLKVYTKGQAQSTESYTEQQPKQILKSLGTEDPYNLQLVDKSGFLEWFPPLRQVIVAYKHYSQRNIMAGQDIVASEFTFPEVDSNNSTARLLFKATIEIRREIELGQPELVFFRKYGLLIQVGNYYLRRTATISNGEVEFQRTMDWSLTPAYYEVFSPRIYDQDDPVFMQIEFITVPLREDGDLEVSLVPLASYELDGSPLNISSYGATEVLLNVHLEIITTGRFEDQANTTWYRAYNLSPGNSRKLPIDTLIGQGPGQNALGAMQVQNASSEWVASTGWRKNDTGTYQNFSQLLANEAMAGQVGPAEKMTAHLIGDYEAHELLIDNTKTRLFNGGRFIAYYDRWEGEWFELGESTEYGISPPIDFKKNNELGPVVDPPTPIIFGGGGGGGAFLTEQRTPYEQVFEDAVGDRVTITVNDGYLPLLKADLVVQLNGNDLTRGQDYTTDGSDIIFETDPEDPLTTPLKGDRVKVKFVF